jgi:hypothetical protein
VQKFSFYGTENMLFLINQLFCTLMNVFTIMRISSQVPGQRDKASNLKAEDVILCCLIRAITRRDGEKRMTIEQ